MNLTIFMRMTLWAVAVCYGYGAVVHVLNIAGLSGFDWPTAPLKWQVLDIVYLILDMIVLVGFIRDWRPAYAAFVIAALSQIVLYTVLRDWILDVPEAFARSPADHVYLDWLVGFHVATLVLVAAILWARRRVA